MPPDFLASDVTIKEEQPTVRAIASAATAVLGMVGISERGPVDQANVINSFAEFERIYGSYNANSDAILAVKGAFENGLTELHFVRTVHHTDPTDPTTKTSTLATLTLLTAATAATAAKTTSTNSAPWAVHTGETLKVVVNGGSALTTTFTGAAALHSTSAGPFTIVDGQTSLLGFDSFNGGALQTVTYHTADFADISAATAAEVAAVINAQIVGGHADVQNDGTINILSDTIGAASRQIVGAGTASALSLSQTTASGSGNVANLHAVTSAEAISLLTTAAGGAYTAAYVASRLVVSSAGTGSGQTIRMSSAGSAQAEFGFDTATHSGSDAGTANTLTVNGKTDGTYANALTVVVSGPTNGAAGYFNLQILSSGISAETWPNLAMSSASQDYALTKINDPNTGSNLIALVDLAASGNNVPASGTFGPLTGGNDGLAGLVDNDFIGGAGVNGDVGMRALDSVQTLTLLCVPGRATASTHNAMVTYCEITRNGQVFAILDPPANQSAAQIVNYFKNTAALQQLSEYFAIYWPRILIDNPNQAVYGAAQLLVAPPCGVIAGLYARVDASRPSGVFVAPAGTDYPLFNVRGLEMPEVKKKAKREIVFPELINPISVEPGTPIFLDGARTGKSNGNFPTIGERRGVMFVEQSLRQGLTFMRHKNINPRLYADGKRTTTLFLNQQTKNEAFASTNPDQAFTVDFGKGINTAAVANARTVIARVGLATSKPAEFIFIKVSPDTRALDAELAAAA